MSRTDALFKAIAHPARRRILTLLSLSDRSVKELTSSFDISQPAVSQHLRELREAKLVVPRKVGSEQKYHLTGEPLKTVFDWCAQYRRFFDPAGHAWAFTATEDAPRSTNKGGRQNGR
jgi:DNA-binding transcriptional ArsR family regulator